MASDCSLTVPLYLVAGAEDSVDAEGAVESSETVLAESPTGSGVDLTLCGEFSECFAGSAPGAVPVVDESASDGAGVFADDDAGTFFGVFVGPFVESDLDAAAVGDE